MILPERLREAWEEIRDNPGRTALQALGVVLGVASVLGGLSITDSFRRQSERFVARQGGMDKLNVQPMPTPKGAQSSALQSANLGLRAADAEAGAALDAQAVAGVSVVREVSALIQSPFAVRYRWVVGIGGDFIPMEGYALDRGRAFAARELETGAPVAILGSRSARTFFPQDDPLGRSLVVDGVPVTVVGLFQPQVFRFVEGEDNFLDWRNRLVFLPAGFVQRRLQADPHLRLDRITFRLPDPGRVEAFSQSLGALLRSNHRFQNDFRMDDMAARRRRQESQGAIYDLVFLLAGVLALVGAGIVNVNIQLASLRDRVREVGLRMALGAPGREVFKGFMTEAMGVTCLGTLAGLGAGVGFSWAITRTLSVPLFLRPSSFLWALALGWTSGFIFALVPAWRAARLSPMEALRYE